MLYVNIDNLVLNIPVKGNVIYKDNKLMLKYPDLGDLYIQNSGWNLMPLHGHKPYIAELSQWCTCGSSWGELHKLTFYVKESCFNIFSKESASLSLVGRATWRGKEISDFKGFITNVIQPYTSNNYTWENALCSGIYCLKDEDPIGVDECDRRHRWLLRNDYCTEFYAAQQEYFHELDGHENISIIRDAIAQMLKQDVIAKSFQEAA